MNIEEIKQAITEIVEVGGVPMLKARPGVGKSEGVKQWSKERANKLGMEWYEGPENYKPNAFGFIDLRLATIDSIELGGLPLIDSTAEYTKFTRSPYIPADGHGVLFLDELPQAKAGNQAAVSQLILDKRVGSHALGKNWVIIAAGNRQEDRSATHKIPAHIQDRLIDLPVEFSSEVFERYATEIGLPEEAIAFAKLRPDVLDSFNPDNDINCTPRSFVLASNFINADEKLRFQLISGTIGEGAAAELIGFVDVYQNLPSLEEFVKNPMRIKIPEKSDHLFACIQMLAHNSNDTNISSIAKFIGRLEQTPERQVQFWKSASNRNKTIIATDEFQEFLNDNQDLLL